MSRIGKSIDGFVVAYHQGIIVVVKVMAGE